MSYPTEHSEDDPDAHVVREHLHLPRRRHAGAGRPQDDPTGGSTHGGWNVTFWDDVMGSAIARASAEPYDLLLGRRTYEIFAAHWP
jgi:hypothetical protein